MRLSDYHSATRVNAHSSHNTNVEQQPDIAPPLFQQQPLSQNMSKAKKKKLKTKKTELIHHQMVALSASRDRYGQIYFK